MPTHKQTTSQTQNLERTGHELTQKQRQESVLPTDVALPKGRQQQIDYIFLCVYCNRSQKTSSRTFLFFTRCDIFCDLLQYTHTEKCYLFVNYSIHQPSTL